MFIHWFKKFSIVTTSIFAFAGYAHATNVTLSYGQTEMVVVANRDAGVTGPFNFTDIFNLDLTVPASFNFLISELNEPAYNIVNGTFSYGLYDSFNHLLTTPSVLTPGSYELRVSGTADGPFGGQYYLSASVINPVPEPETNALMLVGLGVMGFVARRKFS